jgi:transposase
MLYAALDIHKRVFQGGLFDSKTGELTDARFLATREGLDDWAMPLQGRVAAVAIEATTGWRWVWRELSARGFDVRLVDPAEVEARRAHTRRCLVCGPAPSPGKAVAVS